MRIFFLRIQRDTRISFSGNIYRIYLALFFSRKQRRRIFGFQKEERSTDFTKTSWLVRSEKLTMHIPQSYFKETCRQSFLQERETEGGGVCGEKI